MSTTTIESVILPNCRFTGSGIKLRIFLQESFVTSDGIPLQSGNIQNNRWYKEVDCSINSTNLTIPSFTIASTVDGIDRTTARYVAYFFRGNTNLGVYTGFENGFKVPATPASWSWADLRTYNFTIVHSYDASGVYTKDQVNYLIAQVEGAGSEAAYILQTADPALTNAQALNVLGTGLPKLTAGVFSLAIAGTDYLSPSGSGASLTALNASNLSTGTIPDARFPSTLPALSGVNLTALNASNLASGTVPDARFPSTLPAISGANLTALNASNLSSGTLPAGRLPALTGDITSSAGSAATTLATTIPNVHTFSGVMTHIAAPLGDGAQGNTASAFMFRGADSSIGSPLTVGTTVANVGDPTANLQTFRTGGTNGFPTFGFIKNFTLTGASATDTYVDYTIARYSHSMLGAPTGSYSHEVLRTYGILSPTNVNSGASTHNIHMYSLDAQAERTVAGVAVVAGYFETRNSTSSDASVSTTSIDRTYKIVTSTSYTAPSTGAHGTGIIFSEGINGRVSDYFGWYVAANAVVQRGLDFTDMTATLQGTWAANSASATLTGSGGHADVEVIAGCWILVNGFYCRVQSATANAITLTGTFASFGGSGTPSGLTLTKSVQAAWLRVNQPISVLNNAGSARKEIVRLDENDILRFDYDALGSYFGNRIVAGNNLTNRIILQTLTSGSDYPGIWFLPTATAATVANFAFLADIGASQTVFNAPSGGSIDFRINNASKWLINSSGHLITGATDNTEDIGASGATRPRTLYLGTSLIAPVGTFATSISIGGGTALATTNRTGTGNLVLETSPTIVTPTIASFANANHNHTNSAGGGQLSLSAFSSTTGSGAVVGATSPSLTTPDIGAATGTSLSLGGNVTLTGTARRFQADMSNATVSNRFGFQTSTANSSTVMSVIPNGTGIIAAVRAFGGSDPDNANFGGLFVASNAVAIETSKNGTGTTQDIIFRVNGADKMTLSATSFNLKLNGTATRGTTEGTNHLDIFDGTAPVGTLANGISLYSASGECRVMDAAGNSTLLSPHDKVTNEWVYDSVDTRTGKHLRIDMERLMRKLNDTFGGGFIQEFTA